MDKYMNTYQYNEKLKGVGLYFFNYFNKNKVNKVNNTYNFLDHCF
jgi:hypothetical protein